MQTFQHMQTAPERPETPAFRANRHYHSKPTPHKAPLSLNRGMINSIAGRIVEVRNQAILLSPHTGGESSILELEIHIPAYWVDTALESRGRVVRVHTRLHLESVNQGASFVPRLLGFPSAEDRAFFERFTSVKGLGHRKALKALAVEPGVIAGAIAARDARALEKLPEIGKRLAETIIAELHGKLDGVVHASIPESRGSAPQSGSPADEAVAALIALGQTRSEAEQAVSRALRGVPDPAAFSVDEIISRAFAAG